MTNTSKQKTLLGTCRVWVHKDYFLLKIDKNLKKLNFILFYVMISKAMMPLTF